jgi:limonene-1,2-epoxide hydrolase
MSTDPETVVRLFFDELGKPVRLIAACETYLIDDFVWENTGLPTADGKAAAIALMSQFIEGYGLDRLVIDIRSIAASGELVLTERVDHLDDKAGNRILSIPVAGAAEVRDGKITRWSDYFDPRPILPPGA